MCWFNSTRTIIKQARNIRGCADKSLARPGRKQATATKLGIYSIYFSWSSITFLHLALTLGFHSKKNSEICPSYQVTATAMTSASEKNGDASIDFWVQGTGGSPTGPDPENWVVDQGTGSPGRPVSSGFQVPCEPRHCLARTRPTWWSSHAVCNRNSYTTRG